MDGLICFVRNEMSIADEKICVRGEVIWTPLGLTSEIAAWTFNDDDVAWRESGKASNRAEIAEHASLSDAAGGGRYSAVPIAHEAQFIADGANWMMIPGGNAFL